MEGGACAVTQPCSEELKKSEVPAVGLEKYLTLREELESAENI
jgi:hypothetical protein